MKKIITLLTITLLLSSCAQSKTLETNNETSKQETDELTPVTAYAKVPDNWRSEVISLPFDFAPEINLQGVEEILFMPGMYKPEADDYFSYAFVWKVKQSAFSNQEIQANLYSYYSGLYKAVAQKETADVSVQINTQNGGWPINGTIKWTEPFVSKQQQTLSYKAKKISCLNPDETRWYFVVSPQDKTHAVWDNLQSLALTGC